MNPYLTIEEAIEGIGSHDEKFSVQPCVCPEHTETCERWYLTKTNVPLSECPEFGWSFSAIQIWHTNGKIDYYHGVPLEDNTQAWRFILRETGKMINSGGIMCFNPIRSDFSKQWKSLKDFYDDITCKIW